MAGSANERSREIEQLRNRVNDLLEEYEVPEKVNVTPEQVVILREVLDEFTETQGNALVTHFQTWVRENKQLDVHQRTAVQSVLDDLTDVAPTDWRVQDEFADWLDRRQEEVETTNVEVPAGGRTNWESRQGGEGRTNTVEVQRDLSPETHTEEVPIEGGDDPETITVEKEAPSGPTMDDIEEWDQKVHQMRVESSRERQERKEQKKQSRMNGGIPAYEHLNADEDASDDDADVPAGGRSNWEARKDDE